MMNGRYGSEGEKIPEKDRWDGQTERRSVVRGGGNGNGTSFDLKLDRFIKVAGVLKYFLTAIIGALVWVIVTAHNEVDTLNKSMNSLTSKIDQTTQMIVMHDQYRRERDIQRLQSHHQDSVAGGACIKCKMVDRKEGVSNWMPMPNNFGK